MSVLDKVVWGAVFIAMLWAAARFINWSLHCDHVWRDGECQKCGSQRQ